MKRNTNTTKTRTTKRAAKPATPKRVTSSASPIDLATVTKVRRAIPTRGEVQPTALASSVKLPVPTVRRVLRALNTLGHVQSRGRGRDSHYSLATG